MQNNYHAQANLMNKIAQVAPVVIGVALQFMEAYKAQMNAMPAQERKRYSGVPYTVEFEQDGSRKYVYNLPNGMTLRTDVPINLDAEY